MDEREKLKLLVEHWKEHNSEHAGMFRKWADIMGGAGEHEAHRILRELADKTIVLNHYFDKLGNIL